MNNVSLMGRLTRDPEVRYANEKAVAKFSIAVDRIGEGTDFINIVTFGKTAEFIEKYFFKGMRIALTGRIQTGSYEKDGQRVYTFDVIADRVEFCESKNSEAPKTEPKKDADGFMNVPEGIDEELPFSIPTR